MKMEILHILLACILAVISNCKVITVDSEMTVLVDNWETFLLSMHYSQLAGALMKKYRDASPFHNIYIDNIFPIDVVSRCAGEFPDHDISSPLIDGWGAWYQNRNSHNKFFLHDEEKMGPGCIALIHHLRSRMFVSFLEKMTGIPSLLSDPYMHGGGLHQIGRGGFLSVHADFNKRETDGLWRRVNVFIYLNEDWDESFGGHLELWDANMTSCVKKILPVINRLTVFSSTSTSMHGHPDPLQCPPGRYRKSIAMYYYATSHPESANSDDTYVTTNFKQRPGEEWVRPEEL